MSMITAGVYQYFSALAKMYTHKVAKIERGSGIHSVLPCGRGVN